MPLHFQSNASQDRTPPPQPLENGWLDRFNDQLVALVLGRSTVTWPRTAFPRGEPAPLVSFPPETAAAIVYNTLEGVTAYHRRQQQSQGRIEFRGWRDQRSFCRAQRTLWRPSVANFQVLQQLSTAISPTEAIRNQTAELRRNLVSLNRKLAHILRLMQKGTVLTPPTESDIPPLLSNFTAMLRRGQRTNWYAGPLHDDLLRLMYRYTELELPWTTGRRQEEDGTIEDSELVISTRLPDLYAIPLMHNNGLAVVDIHCPEMNGLRESLNWGWPVHPHLNGPMLCLGEYTGGLRDFFRSGDWDNALATIRHILTTHYPMSQFQPPWECIPQHYRQLHSMGLLMNSSWRYFCQPFICRACDRTVECSLTGYENTFPGRPRELQYCEQCMTFDVPEFAQTWEAFPQYLVHQALWKPGEQFCRQSPWAGTPEVTPEITTEPVDQSQLSAVTPPDVSPVVLDFENPIRVPRDVGVSNGPAMPVVPPPNPSTVFVNGVPATTIGVFGVSPSAAATSVNDPRLPF